MVVLSVALLVATTGCGADGGAGTPSSSQNGSDTKDASPVAAAELPQGIYRTDPLTAEDLVDAATAAGYPQAKAEGYADHYTGSVVFELLVTADTFVQREVVDDGPPEDGSSGTYVVTDPNTIVTTDPCSETTFDFAIEGNTLDLDLVDSHITGCDISSDDIILGTMVFESGPFRLQDSSSQVGGTQAAGTAQTVDAFVAPFTIQLADWLDPGSTDAGKQFVTWQSTDEQRALRVLSPVSVYQPGSSAEAPPPTDFPAYILSLAAAGATITDRVDTQVDGHAAVEVSVGLTTGAGSLDGALGCPEPGLDAADCFGPQDELVLRLVAVTVSGTPILIWERDYADRSDSVDYAAFDAMVASIRFT
jgi:hypothetical protein